jgi:hypothetical protein
MCMNNTYTCMRKKILKKGEMEWGSLSWERGYTKVVASCHNCTHCASPSIEAWIGSSGRWGTRIITIGTVLSSTLRDTLTRIASTLNLSKK